LSQIANAATPATTTAAAIHGIDFCSDLVPPFAPQHRLYFTPLPQGQRSFAPTFSIQALQS
jgi:hypothetical protein